MSDQSASAQGRQLFSWRKLTFLVLLLSILEGWAWLLDARYGFRAELLFAYERMQFYSEPVTPQAEVEWPEHISQTIFTTLPAPAICVRAREDALGSMVSYDFGGRWLSDVCVSKECTVLAPDQMPTGSTRRVFVVGGSAAFGYHCRYEETFPALCETPDATVFNCAQVGWTSGQVVPLVHRIVDHYQPDTVIILCGNNEWDRLLPPDHFETSMTAVRSLTLLAHSRAIAGLQFAMIKAVRSGHQYSNSHGGEFVPHVQLTGLGSALLHDFPNFDPIGWQESKQIYLENFENNITLMTRHAQAAGTRVVLLTMPFNYKLSPVWKHPQPESFDPVHAEATHTSLHAAKALMDQGHFDQALAELDHAITLDPWPAVPHHMRGACLESTGRFDEAAEAYANCRENMVGNLGSRLSINASISRVAKETGADLIDLSALFAENGRSRGHYFNDDLLIDDCHLSALGHAAVADALRKVVDTD